MLKVSEGKLDVESSLVTWLFLAQNVISYVDLGETVSGEM